MSEQNNSFTGEIEYSIPYILRQIALIQGDTSYLSEALSMLGSMPSSTQSAGPDAAPYDIQGQARARAAAIGDIVKSRETTNQLLLRLYEKMYDDLK